MRKAKKLLLKTLLVVTCTLGMTIIATAAPSNLTEVKAATVHVVKNKNGAVAYAAANTSSAKKTTIPQSEIVSVTQTVKNSSGTFYKVSQGYILASKCTGAMTKYVSLDNTSTIVLTETTKLALIPSEAGSYKDGENTSKGKKIKIDGYVYNSDGRLYYQSKKTNKFIMAARANTNDTTLPSDVYVDGNPVSQKQNIYFHVTGKYKFYKLPITSEANVKTTKSFSRGDLLKVKGYMKDKSGSNTWFFTNYGYIKYDRKYIYDCNNDEKNDFKCALVNYAKKFDGLLHYTQGIGNYVGTRYLGSDLDSIVGKGTSIGVDCSSFVASVYYHFGIINVPTTTSQYEYSEYASKEKSMSKLEKGDIVWRKGHVEIYIGNGKTMGAHDDFCQDNGGDCSGDVCINNMGTYTKVFDFLP